jgi:hypothetical protein
MNYLHITKLFVYLYSTTRKIPGVVVTGPEEISKALVDAGAFGFYTS